MAKTIEQKRAAAALESVQNVQSGTRFTALANGMPTMIHVNGLGQALAFCAGKNDLQYVEMRSMLSAWLCNEGNPFAGTQPEHILETITQCDMTTYMRAQAEAMAYLLWVKKFAKAFLGDEI